MIPPETGALWTACLEHTCSFQSLKLLHSHQAQRQQSMRPEGSGFKEGFKGLKGRLKGDFKRALKLKGSFKGLKGDLKGV